MSKIAKKYSKHQKYLKYLLILYQNIETKLIYLLSLGILTYVIQIYMWYFILLINFEKFKVYNEFLNFKNHLNGLFEPEPNPQRSEPNLDQNLEIPEWG